MIVLTDSKEGIKQHGKITRKRKHGYYEQGKWQLRLTQNQVSVRFSKEDNTNLSATWMQFLAKEYYFLKMCLKSFFLKRSLKALKQLSGTALIFTRGIHSVNC